MVWYLDMYVVVDDITLPTSPNWIGWQVDSKVSFSTEAGVSFLLNCTVEKYSSSEVDLRNWS